MKKCRAAAALVLLAAALTACSVGPGPTASASLPSAVALAQVATGASYYLGLENQAYLGNLESDDLNGAFSAGGGTSAAAQSVTVHGWSYTLADGTFVDVVELTDDNGTMGTQEDDVVTITRTYRVWGGTTEKIEKIVRPVRPQASWSGWVADRLVQAGTVEEFLQGVRVKAGSLSVTWRRFGSSVWAAEVIKEVHWVDRSSMVDRLDITFDQNGTQTKKLYRTRLTPQGDVAVHCITFEDFTENGTVYTRGILEDGSSFVVRSPRDPLVVDQYTPAGTLWMTNTETQVGRSRTTVQQYYDAAGNVTRTAQADFSARFLGDEVLITRSSGGSTANLLIAENEHGFSVSGERSFVVWFVGGAIEIYDSSMNLIATVTFDTQGGCLVTYPGQAAVAVTL